MARMLAGWYSEGECAQQATASVPEDDYYVSPVVMVSSDNLSTLALVTAPRYRMQIGQLAGVVPENKPYGMVVVLPLHDRTALMTTRRRVQFLMRIGHSVVVRVGALMSCEDDT